MDLQTALERYYNRFGDWFPMYPLANGRTDSEVIDIIQSCLDSGKDVTAAGLYDDDTQDFY